MGNNDKSSHVARASNRDDGHADGYKVDGHMKTTIAWMVIAASLTTGLAQTSTNVDYLTLNLNIGLTATTNGVPDTNGSIVSSKSGTMKINSASIIDLLSGRRSFPLGKIVDGNGTTIPHRGPAVMTNFSNAARLLLMQGLGTNHDSTFVVVRDGHRPVNYDVSEYFSINTRGFPPATDTTVATTNNFDLDTTEETSTRVSLTEFSFDDTPETPDAPDRVAFTVDGFTTVKKAPVSAHGEVIDPGATRLLNSTVAGTGIVTNTLAVLKGSIIATGPRHETN